MKRLSKHVIHKEIMDSYINGDNMDFWFFKPSDFVRIISLKDFEIILQHTIYSRTIVIRLNLLLEEFCQMEEYEYAILVRDYLKKNEDIYLY